jgi:hypothetical protein
VMKDICNTESSSYNQTITFHKNNHLSILILSEFMALFQQKILQTFLPYPCKSTVIPFTEKIQIKIFPVC